jgi:tRNA(Arg) A34 adenosine deaminase TadA
MSGGAGFLHDLAEPWRRCLELAWASYVEGSIPVGVVLTDAAGSIVASGRNRAFGGPNGTGIAGSYVAHAEINALSTLAPGEYGDHVLWSSLEPCFLCSAAAAHSHVGSIRFAAADPLMRGVERLPDLNEWLRSRWPARDGPEPDPLARAAALLHLVWNVERRPDGVVARAYRAADPELLRQARSIAAEGGLRGSIGIEEAIEVLVEPETGNGGRVPS